MAWHHVETTTPDCTKCKIHEIYRCGNCRALAVCGEGEKPSGPCLKCKSKG